MKKRELDKLKNVICTIRTPISATRIFLQTTNPKINLHNKKTLPLIWLKKPTLDYNRALDFVWGCGSNKSWTCHTNLSTSLIHNNTQYKTHLPLLIAHQSQLGLPIVRPMKV